MERYVRIAVPGAAVGLVLSVLIGLLAGVSFGTVILRGIVSGLLFGGGSVGLFLLAQQMLPGLTGDSEKEETAELDETGPQVSHPRVDIVVEDEIEDADNGDGRPVDKEGEDESGYEDTQEIVEEFDEEGGVSATMDREPAVQYTEQPKNVAPAGIAEEAEDDAEIEEAQEIDEDELVEEVEEQTAEDAETIMNQAIAEEKYGGGVEISDAVLDEMPDIGSFSGSFVDSDPADAQEDGEAAGYSSFGGAGRGSTRRSGSTGQAGNDPETIAKALKTMLSRDEKE